MKKRDYKTEGKIRHAKCRLWYDNHIANCRCEHCGNTDFRTFEWHHLDPNKKDLSISKMIGRYSISAILSELQKCICLCANCHRILHHNEKGKIRKKRLHGVQLDV